MLVLCDVFMQERSTSWRLEHNWVVFRMDKMSEVYAQLILQAVGVVGLNATLLY